MKSSLLSFIIVFSSILFVSCGTSVLYISNTLPSEMQQNINTGKSKDVAFDFVGHPKGDLLEVNAGPMWDSAFPLNNPFKGLLTELLNSKYGYIDSNSKNKVKIQITNLEPNLDKGGLSDGLYTLKMSVRVEVNRDSLDTKNFTYDIGVPLAYGFEGANAAFKSNLSKGVKDLLVKFVISIDKYLDSINL
ncbi:MAG: hypothetical protein FJW56_05710 [Actinobacteria bacterium]|nr:hypothetical protein [Actinomycetota bacterium]